MSDPIGLKLRIRNHDYNRLIDMDEEQLPEHWLEYVKDEVQEILFKNACFGEVIAHITSIRRRNNESLDETIKEVRHEYPDSPTDLMMELVKTKLGIPTIDTSFEDYGQSFVIETDNIAVLTELKLRWSDQYDIEQIYS